MGITVVPYSEEWPGQFERLARDLRAALSGVVVVGIEHVGSTAVPGLAAKPILDVDVVVRRADVATALAALAEEGYLHRGDLGVTDREALAAPDNDPRRNVYVCVEGTLHVRNHLAVRDVLRENAGLRDRYASVKIALADDPAMEIARYLAGKSAVLQDVLALSDLSDAEKLEIHRLNTSM